MQINQGIIKELTYEYPNIHLIHLNDGRVIGINSECICLYKDMDDFYECGTNEIPTINLLKD